MLAGSGIPRWIFDDYVPSCTGVGCVVATATGIVPQLVVPVQTSDLAPAARRACPRLTNAATRRPWDLPPTPRIERRRSP